MVDSVGATRFGYNADGSLASEDGPWADDTVSLGSQNRLRSALTLANPNAAPWSETYAYDAMRRLTNIVSPVGAFGYSYSAGLNGFAGAPRLVQRTSLPNAAYVTNSFDALGRLSRTELRNSSHAVLGQHLYSLNLAHQRTGITNVAGNYVEYTYDPVGQLATATGKESGGATTRLHEKFGYGYDAGGNLQYRTNNALIQTFAVDNLNRLTTVTRNTSGTVAGMTSGANTNVNVNTLAASRYSDNTFAKDGFTLVDGTNTFTAIAQDNLGRSATNAVRVWMPLSASFQYDLNGNLLSDGRRGFEYDAENQLTRVTVTNAWRTEFTYDGRLRRRVRREFTWNGSAFVQTGEVRYIYDGMRVVQERDGNNVPLVAYTRGLDLSGTLDGAGGIGGLLARHDLTQGAPVPAYYHADGNGNVTTLINAQQYVVARYHYDPYGQLLGQAGPLSEANLYRFSSKEHHATANLYYYGYRFYEPSFQRWLNRDLLGELPDHNLFRFLANAPTLLFDALGLSPSLIRGTGVFICFSRGKTDRPYDHAWLEGNGVAGGSAGFYPMHGDGKEDTKGPGRIASPDLYAKRPGKECTEIKLNLACQSIARFRECIKRETSKIGPCSLNYHWKDYNCAHWAENVFRSCMRESTLVHR